MFRFRYLLPLESVNSGQASNDIDRDLQGSLIATTMKKTLCLKYYVWILDHLGIRSIGVRLRRYRPILHLAP